MPERNPGQGQLVSVDWIYSGDYQDILTGRGAVAAGVLDAR